jgi:hypothetical protein
MDKKRSISMDERQLTLAPHVYLAEIVVNGENVLSWEPGLTSRTTLENFLSGSYLLFDSGALDVHYRRKEG